MPQTTRSAGAPPQLSVEPFASGFSNLTFVTNAGDGSGSLYAIEQAGRIRLVTPGSTQGGRAFLDLTDRVSVGGERGLLGLAFDPNFASNGRFFVDYTNLSGNTVISRFTRAADGMVDPGAETIVLTVDQPFSNHNGGMLAFGADGDLYIGLGDGGSGGDPQGNGQNLDTLLGKILRIDVASGTSYAIPADNPFVSGTAAGGPARPEIWDYGVRNPWRFSFDRQTDALFIGDVGQDAYEEVDVEQPGSGRHDYGWSLMEGLHCYGATTCNQTGFTLPAVEYPHSLGCAVTGGYVYRGSAYPSLVGRYVFGDYCSGRLFAFIADDALAGRPVAALQVGQVPFSISSFGQDEAGELYVVDLAGAIYRLVAAG
ncbi:MAG TPA: PQQ-dependent sugar dehydrogenase [Candidatus Limnocylindrales bacterium]